jgi:hypothetical protein
MLAYTLPSIAISTNVCELIDAVGHGMTTKTDYSLKNRRI